MIITVEPNQNRVITKEVDMSDNVMILDCLMEEVLLLIAVIIRSFKESSGKVSDNTAGFLWKMGATMKDNSTICLRLMAKGSGNSPTAFFKAFFRMVISGQARFTTQMDQNL